MAGEFKGDFTRDTFYAHRHYCSVFQQQGRVSLDADGNEQASILLNMLRSVCKDAIADGDAGPNKQFNLVQIAPPAGSTDRDFGIMPGHVFVDGIQAILNGKKNPFAIPPTAPAGQVAVSQWLVDGIPYQKGQYVVAVVVDPNNPADTPFTSAVPSSIDALDPNSRTLTLRPALTAPAGPQNGYRLIRLPSFLHQPDYVPTDDEVKALNSLSPNKNAFLVYLDLWERHVSFVQNPWIREVALGGADTCVRSQLLAQIKIAWDFESQVFGRTFNAASVPVVKSALEDQYQPYNRGWLRCRLKPVDSNNPDPCMCHPDARYRGAENQLYRVEIHFPGQAPSSSTTSTVGVAAPAAGASSSTPTFKWSRNNGCDVYPVISVKAAEVLLDSVGRDARSTLKSGDWVELLDDTLILQGKCGQLLQVSEVSAQDRRVTMGSASAYDVTAKDPNHPHAFLRRWDQKDPSTGGTSSGLPITEAATSQTDPWIDLEDGIQIQFITALSPNLPANPGSANFVAPVNKYRTGDYWLIPARTALQGSIEWPATADNPAVPIALPPHGIDHHYLPLGVLTLTTANQLGVTSPFITEITPIT